jgi:hypothetical protein
MNRDWIKLLSEKDGFYRLSTNNFRPKLYYSQCPQLIIKILKNCKEINEIDIFHYQWAEELYNIILLNQNIKKMNTTTMEKFHTKLFCDFISNENCPIRTLTIRSASYRIEHHNFFKESLQKALAKNTSICVLESSNTALEINIIYSPKYHVDITENWNKPIRYSDHLEFILKEQLLINENIDDLLKNYEEIIKPKSRGFRIFPISYCYTLFLHCVLRKFISKDIVKLILGDYHYFVDFDGKLFKTHKKISFKKIII